MKEPSQTAIAITSLLYKNDSPVKNLVALEFSDDVAKDAQAWLDGYSRALRNHLRNTAPKMPGSDGTQHSYPDREATKPEYIPAPDASETETSIPSKPSTPEYSDYSDCVAALQLTGETLWSDETGEEAKTESIRTALEALDNIQAMLKQF
jgi:hypothetical protein